MTKKVCFCIPTRRKPIEPFLQSLEASIPLVCEAGWEEGSAWEIGNAYVSYARALLLRKALKWMGDDDGHVVFLDDDLSWEPKDLLTLLETPGDIVAGTYRFKSPVEEYMGRLDKDEGSPIPPKARNGCYPAFLVPAGFLKISRVAVEIYIRKYSTLDFSRKGYEYYYDLFNHGVIDHTWFGEDYAFSLRWKLIDQPLWLRPDLSITHHGKNIDGKDFTFPGNFEKYVTSEAGEMIETKKGKIVLEGDEVLAGDVLLELDRKYEKEEVL